MPARPMNLPHPIRFLAMSVTLLFVGTYLAVCDWWDERKARKAGAEPETSND